jgi:hypothetical protein
MFRIASLGIGISEMKANRSGGGGCGGGAPLDGRAAALLSRGGAPPRCGGADPLGGNGNGGIIEDGEKAREGEARLRSRLYSVGI